jgi:integral membrane protein (TIGR01906 family)
MSTKHKSKIEVPNNIIIILFSIAIFIIILFGSLNMMIFNKDLYYKEYSKNGVYITLSDNKDTGKEIATNITENVIKYFRNTEELQYFTNSEKSHMADVKHLIRTMQFIYYGAAIISIGLFFYCYRKFKDDKYMFIRVLAKSLLYSSIAAGVFLVLMFLMSVFAFDFLFTMFHLTFFPQGNWMFDSSSLLITMFPQQFFFDITLRIFIYAMFQALIFFGMGYWMNKQLKIYEKHHTF